MNDYASQHLSRQAQYYERATRQIRFLTVTLVLLTLPLGQPQTFPIAILCTITLLYNASRLIPNLINTKLYSSRAATLGIDLIFILALLLAANRIDTAYSAFLVIALISATYWFGLRGILVTLVGQMAIIAVAANLHLYQPILLDPVRTIGVSLGFLLSIALLIEQLTHVERSERDNLVRLSNENNSQKEQLTTLINSLAFGAMVVDGDGKVILANSAMDTFTSHHDDITGMDISELLPIKRLGDPVKLASVVTTATAPQSHRDFTLPTPEGIELNLDLTITPTTTRNDIKNYIVLVRDITNEKSLDEQRQEFIAVASHELRTPLAITEAALSAILLAKKDLSPEIVTYAEQAHRNVFFLGGLVKELNTLSDAENDNVPVQIAPVNARNLVQQLQKDFTAQAKAKGLSIKELLMPDLPTILSTEHHIREILQNFVSNAIKYTNEGGIIIKAEPAPHEGVLFSVQDSGIGISAQAQSKLFTKFYRVEDYRTRKTGGSGLGLYLSLELASRINGRVWCRSKLKQGSTFFLEVPPFSRLSRDQGKVVEAQVSQLIDQL